jgi:hypothetical protein
VRRSEVAELAEIEQAIAKYGVGIKFYDHFNLPQHPSQNKKANSKQETLEELDSFGSKELVPSSFD